MNRIILLSFIVLTISCIDEKPKEIERINLSPTILVDSLLNDMPGSILVYENELIWKKHSRQDGFIHIFDKTTGKEKITFGNIKDGTTEIMTPRLIKGKERELLIYDLGGNKILFFQLDSILKGNNEPLDIMFIDNCSISDMIIVSEKSYLILDNSASRPFLFLSSDEKYYVGHHPVEIPDGVDKTYIFDGTISYNPYNGYLLHNVGRMSYLSLYKYSNKIFKQKWEKVLSKVNYKIVNNKLKASRPLKDTPGSTTLTKDYIVTIERDSINKKKYPKKEGEIRKFSKAPNTLFIYDYDWNLLKIIDIDLPILRLASDGLSNEVFFIGVNPEFCIGKCII